MLSEDAATVPTAVTNQVVSIELHGSGGGVTPSPQGRLWEAALAGGLEYDQKTTFKWSEVKSVRAGVTAIRPYDTQGNYPSGARRESYWMGWTDGPDVGKMRLYTERTLDALMDHIAAHQANIGLTKWVLSGGSMGAWGTMTYGIRRPTRFAALYPDRPRWRYNNTVGNVSIVSWNSSTAPSYPVASAPLKVDDDGGGSMAAHLDHIAYVSDTSKQIPWIGWCVGRNDGYTPFSDHIAAVAALRAAKRGFAFVWNDGNHSVGSIPSQITSSYPPGTFEVGKGYPLFTNHSGDQDPAVDLSGGINLGLTFRNVVESAAGWSCEVTSLLGARTVTVEPKSAVFVKAVSPQVVNIPAANTWVAVAFS
ncbi:hypothetical protein LNV23_18890 [Paucibacter sp. DJ1R-11]|uniref:hypothetical protein n=1 Tax=Paucibacter sp. DJ1R-11 TaxID=2893556 RepID=UPI0021E35B94|nr:hypothetical protein [Paucibacter sp. DJ1R-11]MCV2365520.1 hypothetical protein [Paucibacter sp. DJ1R-11]